MSHSAGGGNKQLMCKRNKPGVFFHALRSCFSPTVDGRLCLAFLEMSCSFQLILRNIFLERDGKYPGRGCSVLLPPAGRFSRKRTPVVFQQLFMSTLMKHSGSAGTAGSTHKLFTSFLLYILTVVLSLLLYLLHFCVLLLWRFLLKLW